jgi:hypothetical protein
MLGDDAWAPELPDDLVDDVLLRAFRDDPCSVVGDAALDGRMVRLCLHPARPTHPARLAAALLARGRPAALLRLLRRASAARLALDPPQEAWRAACHHLHLHRLGYGSSADWLHAVHALYGFHGAACNGGMLALQLLLLRAAAVDRAPAPGLDALEPGLDAQDRSTAPGLDAQDRSTAPGLDIYISPLLAAWVRAGAAPLLAGGGGGGAGTNAAHAFFEPPPAPLRGVELVHQLFEARCLAGLAVLAASGLCLRAQAAWSPLALSRQVRAHPGCVDMMARLGYRTTMHDLAASRHSPPLLLAYLRCWAQEEEAGRPTAPEAGQGLHRAARAIERGLQRVLASP